MGDEGAAATPEERQGPRERAGRREQNKAENRTALLKAARAVFAEMGYGAASVRDIVRRTDLASGTFYNYFKDKDEIFEAVVGELTGELLKRHQEGRGKATTTEEFFRRHYAVYFDFIAGDPELLALARRNFTAIRTLLDKPDVRALARALNEDIRAACAKGILPDVDAGYLAAAIGGVAFEISMVMVARDPVDPAGAAEFATRLMMAGIGGVPRRNIIPSEAKDLKDL
jgi:AcrR family transcriptional regulator